MPRPKKQVEPALMTIGTAGLRWFGERLMEGSLAKLTGAAGQKRLRDYANLDMIAGPALRLQELYLRDVSFSVKPADTTTTEETGVDPAVAMQRAAFVDSCLRDMSHTTDAMWAECSTMSTYGWAALEVTCKYRAGEDVPESQPWSRYDDGLVGLESIRLRGQETLYGWERKNGRVVAMRQSDPWAGTGSSVVNIPLEKMLHVRTTVVKDDPEGRSPLGPSYLAWELEKKYRELEAIEAGRCAGIPVLRAPAEVVEGKADNATKKAAAERLLYGLVQDVGAGLLLPSTTYGQIGSSGSTNTYQWDIAFVGPTTTKASTIRETIRSYEQRRAGALLIGFMILGQDRTGTQALAETLAESIFLRAVNSVAYNIASSFTHQVIPLLMRLNGWSVREAPSLVAKPLTKAPDLKEFTAYLQFLETAVPGIFATPEVQTALAGRADLPYSNVSTDEL